MTHSSRKGYHLNVTEYHLCSDSACVLRFMNISDIYMMSLTGQRNQ